MKNTLLLSFILIVFSSSAQVENGLVAHFKLDSADFTDEVGTANGLTSTRGNGSFSSTSDKTSTKNTATNFSGGISEAGTGGRKISNSLTVSTWIKTTQNVTTSSAIVSQYNCATKAGFLFSINQGTVQLDVRDNSSNGYMKSGKSSRIDDNLWHHIVGTLSSSGRLSIWVDGKRESINSYGSINSLSSGCGLAIGGLSSLNTLNQAGEYLGDMDELRIYNRTLDSLEIDTLSQYPYSTASVSNVENQKIMIYPNPANSILSISGIEGYSNYSTYSINDAFGRIVQQGEVLKSISLQQVSNGQYTLTLHGKKFDKIAVAKFVVIK
jgi:hypothetical protein